MRAGRDFISGGHTVLCVYTYCTENSSERGKERGAPNRVGSNSSGGCFVHVQTHNVNSR